MELGILDMKTPVSMTPMSFYTPPTDCKDRGHLDKEDDILDGCVLNKTCLQYGVGYLGHENSCQNDYNVLLDFTIRLQGQGAY